MQEATSTRFTASPAQRWVRAAADRASSHPWVQLAAVLHGRLHDEQFSAAAAAVADRHEILRTRVLVEPGDGDPFQVIDHAVDVDVRRLAVAADVRGEIRRVAATERTRLDGARPVRIALLRPPLDGVAAVVITARAELADRASLRLWLGELAHGLALRRQPPVAVQYADYAAWHDELLADPLRSSLRDYWNPRLVGTTATPVPFESWGRSCSSLDAPVVDAVAVLAGRYGTTEAAVLTAAWAALAWRLSGDVEDGVGAVLACRSHDELAGAIGPFAREVPLQVRCARDLPFDVLVNRVGEELTGAREHVDDLDPARYAGSATAIECVDAAAALACDGFRLEPVLECSQGVAPVLLSAERGDGEIRLELSHATAVLSRPRAAATLARFEGVLRTVAARPGTPVGRIPILLTGERDRLVAAASGPTGPRTAGATVHSAFGVQARSTPDATAVEDGSCRLTYAELDCLSDVLAAELVAARVGQGDLVPLLVGRSVEFVVGLLGVLKAGAGYVPIDPALPDLRRRRLVDDVAARLVVIDATAPVPTGLSVRVLRCPGSPAAVIRAPRVPSTVGGQDGQIAYVLYTSGSTGSPRGVPVTHAALMNYLLWAAEAYSAADGAALVATSVGFDLTVTGLLAPLLVGGRVVLVPEDGPAGLAAALDSIDEVALLKVTPSHLDAVAQLVDPAGLAATVRVLVVGGEPLTEEVLAPFRTAWPGVRIVNEYGPTETVVGCCSHQLPPDDGRRAATGGVPIGRPIPGTSAHLLDASGEPVPDGVPGELWIGGAGVSVGYLGQREATQARFVDDPFHRGGRMYRTGDRAVRIESGELVFLGRTDEQISLRGQRIEPGEIEAVLREHPRIAQAAVVGAGAARGGAQRLVAFAVARPGDPPGDLRHFCRQRLPASHVPAIVHLLPRLPVTDRGKIDRADLAARAATRTGGELAPPRTAVEEILAGAIASVLGRERVGIDDNYFVLGGDSIRSVMVASRVQASGVRLSVADMHRYPTVRELAVAVESAQPLPPEVRTRPLELTSAADRAALPPGVEDAFPLNLLQEGMIFHREFAARSAVYHAIATVRLRAPLRIDLMRTVVNRLVARHPMLRTSFDLTTFSRPLQLVHTEFADPLSFEDLAGLPAAVQEARLLAWVEREKERGFDLHEHPLIRFVVHRLDEDTFQFTYGFHHEIVDGWSEALMVTELFGHYFGLVFDEPVAVPPPASSMRDAVALELEALQRRENHDFWSEYLRGATLMRLPRRGAGPVADKGQREIVRIPVEVPVELSDGVKRVARDLAVPLKSVLLGAHMAVMNRYHGQDDTLTYTVTNGRPEGVDGTRAIGLFVNSLALRVRLTGGSWRDLVTQTLDSERCSMPYRRLPMAELKRHQGNEPLAETLFFFTDYHVFRELDRWKDRGVEHVAGELYGESTFPFCAIFRLDRETSALEVRIEYDGLEFPAELMAEIARCYRNVLEAMVDDPDGRYDRAFLLGDAERAALGAWSDGGPAVTGCGRIDEIVTEWARRTPDAVAVTDGSQTLTYAAVEQAAERLADVLGVAGARPGATVAVLADRAPAAVVALLAILRTGAAYAPVDPHAPAERVAAVLRRCAPAVVLADTAAAGAAAPWPVLELGPALWAGSDVPARRRPRIGPDDVAYVLHTSGSSGEPKGVLVTHAALARSTMVRSRVYPERPERFLLLSPLTVDSSMVGMLWPLSVGASVQVPPQGLQWEPAAIGRFVEGHGTTHVLAVPVLLGAVLRQSPPRSMRGLRRMITAGDACPAELPRLLADVGAPCAFANEYGPTENTVWSTALVRGPGGAASRVGVGRPVPGVRAHVLDERGRQAPVGVAGELHLAGAALARGYLGEPGATAARFGPDPFAAAAGERMYRTGDLVRWTGDGELEFLGRVDEQVKIRGFRVEPAEVELALDSHPAVHRSVVVARGDGAETVLVGYVAVSQAATVTPEQLQHHVRDRLPRYMVPAACVVLDALPVTPAGKVDRSALPVPAPQAVSGAPPQTPAEQFVADVWRHVLQREEIGVDVDFFDAGGESLRAMEVVNRANALLGLNLPVRALFDAPTIASFAAIVAAAQAAAGATAGLCP